MLAFKQWLVTTLVNDNTLKNYLKDPNNNMNVFPIDVDVQPDAFPCIVYQDVGVTVLSTPQGMHVGNMQLDIYSLTSALEAETIYEQVATLLNFRNSLNATQTVAGTLWWMREEQVRDMHESERRLWRKVVTIKYWYSRPNFT